MIQVGTKGVAVCQRKFFGGALRRIAWISWEDVRLDIPGAVESSPVPCTFGRKGQAASVMVVDYEQAKAISTTRISKATFARYPMWLEKGLGIPRSRSSSALGTLPLVRSPPPTKPTPIARSARVTSQEIGHTLEGSGLAAGSGQGTRETPSRSVEELIWV